jgi:hypothetical protein
MTSSKDVNDPVIDTYRTALDIALTEMVIMITEARDCLYSTEHRFAAIGVLSLFDEKTADAKAALRLYTNALQSRRGS